MPSEFLGIAATNDGSETTPRSGAAFDKEYTLRLAWPHEDHGWDRVLFAYGSGSPDPAPAAAYIASRLERLQILLAHRPNVSYPTFAAKTFATLDRISVGRLTVHFITGGNDHEQGREGDTLTKDERYPRTREYIRIVKKIWTTHEPFDHEGAHYRFHDFVSDVFPVQQPRSGVSFGGSSPAAYAAGGAEADIYCLWGEPLAKTAEQIEHVKAAAKAAGRTDVPRIQVAFRPIIAPTEELAWEKAHRAVGAIKARKKRGHRQQGLRRHRTGRRPGRHRRPRLRHRPVRQSGPDLPRRLGQHRPAPQRERRRHPRRRTGPLVGRGGLRGQAASRASTTPSTCPPSSSSSSTSTSASPPAHWRDRRHLHPDQVTALAARRPRARRRRAVRHRHLR
ncbi:LLM class flavin-dependent oxidoreductase [Streptomyces paradoxus]|uniref:LLM class flavin-dependent oxidoreductase n=1 Tax=Streptomyces paradoxus TaxID=66375 RepID=UPI0036FED80F